MTASSRRTTGNARGDLSQQRFTASLNMKNNANLTAFQPRNANLTSISAISTSATGVIIDTGGIFTASTLGLIGDVTGSITGLSTTLTLATVNANVGTFNGITVNAKGQVTAATNQGYITGLTISGDASGTGTSTLVLTLATVNSNIGTFNSVTVNAKGLVTAASNVKQAPSYQAIVSGVAQTVFNTSVNTVTNKVMVFNLRTKQIEGIDYTVTGANQITFGTGITVGNTVEFYSFA